MSLLMKLLCKMWTHNGLRAQACLREMLSCPMSWRQHLYITTILQVINPITSLLSQDVTGRSTSHKVLRSIVFLLNLTAGFVSYSSTLYHLNLLDHLHWFRQFQLGNSKVIEALTSYFQCSPQPLSWWIQVMKLTVSPAHRVPYVISSRLYCLYTLWRPLSLANVLGFFQHGYTCKSKSQKFNYLLKSSIAGWYCKDHSRAPTYRTIKIQLLY